MKPLKNPINDLEVTAKKTKGAASADDLHVRVEVEVPAGTCMFAELLKQDVFNLTVQNNIQGEKLGILKLNVHIVFKEGEVMTQHLEKIDKTYKLSKAKDAKFEFDNADNSLLLVEVFIDGIRPEGTKRRVITYEDSEDIDDGISEI